MSVCQVLEELQLTDEQREKIMDAVREEKDEIYRDNEEDKLRERIRNLEAQVKMLTKKELGLGTGEESLSDEEVDGIILTACR